MSMGEFFDAERGGGGQDKAKVAIMKRRQRTLRAAFSPELHQSGLASTIWMLDDLSMFFLVHASQNPQ